MTFFNILRMKFRRYEVEVCNALATAQGVPDDEELRVQFYSVLELIRQSSLPGLAVQELQLSASP